MMTHHSCCCPCPPLSVIAALWGCNANMLIFRRYNVCYLPHLLQNWYRDGKYHQFWRNCRYRNRLSQCTNLIPFKTRHCCCTSRLAPLALFNSTYQKSVLLLHSKQRRTDLRESVGFHSIYNEVKAQQNFLKTSPFLHYLYYSSVPKGQVE